MGELAREAALLAEIDRLEEEIERLKGQPADSWMVWGTSCPHCGHERGIVDGRDDDIRAIRCRGCGRSLRLEWQGSGGHMTVELIEQTSGFRRLVRKARMAKDEEAG